ncbi:hypothetical protein BBJ28_00019298 [Nothophytophthora sp. Chile5]|nr:hypothetical protein BBJ28_00019298 [Nothophytophthora sp. Chile5]
MPPLRPPMLFTSQPFDLSDLDGCTVMLLDQSDQVQIDNLTNCRVFIGTPPSPYDVIYWKGDISYQVYKTTFQVLTLFEMLLHSNTTNSKQLRTRDCSACSVYLYSLTDPIIETSQQMLFAPFNGAYCGLDRVPGAAASLGACVNPVARDSGFVEYIENSSSSSSAAAGGMQSFSFSTSQKDAEKVLQATPAAVPPQPIAPTQSLPAAPAVVLTPAAPLVVVAVPSSLPPPAPVASNNSQKQAVVEAPEHRKWYARAWWVGVHVYGYVALGYHGALSPQTMSTAEFVLCLIVAAATISCYAVLQLSSPGHLERRPLHASIQPPDITYKRSESDSPLQVAADDGDDAELLVTEMEGDRAASTAAGMHFCEECQCLEAAVMISVTSSAFSMGDDVNDWFKINALYIVLWFMLMCVLLIVVPLSMYQVFLISTNQVSSLCSHCDHTIPATVKHDDLLAFSMQCPREHLYTPDSQPNLFMELDHEFDFGMDIELDSLIGSESESDSDVDSEKTVDVVADSPDSTQAPAGVTVDSQPDSKQESTARRVRYS